jgi:hypothetical protein
VSFVITHATGTRSIAAYSLPDWERSYALETVRPHGSSEVVTYGDRLIDPAVYSVRCTLTGASLAAAYQLAFTVIEEANSATQVATYEGTLLVDGIVTALVEPADHGSVALTLAFAPTKSEFEP